MMKGFYEKIGSGSPMENQLFWAKNFSKREYISKLLIKESEKMGITCKTIGEMKSIMKRLENQLAKEAAQAKETRGKKDSGKQKDIK